MTIAALINANARRGSTDAVNWIRELLPDARLVLTASVEEARRWLAKEIRPNPPELLLGGGGDGTMVGLLNDLRELGIPFPVLGALPLGTGNAWARVTGGSSLRRCLHRLASRSRDGKPLPVRSFALVESEGRLAHFGGTGWDAEIIHDYQSQLEMPLPGMRARTGVLGYLLATATRTVPRHLREKRRMQVTLVNLGEPPMTVDASGQPLRRSEASPGGVLYQGTAVVASAATTTEWGYGFRAFPFAHAVDGRVSARIYAGTTVEAMRNAVKLWRGVHPLPNMHDFLLTRARMEFDRPVPVEMGGDLVGMRESFEFSIAREQVRLLDWRSL